MSARFLFVFRCGPAKRQLGPTDPIQKLSGLHRLRNGGFEPIFTGDLQFQLFTKKNQKKLAIPFFMSYTFPNGDVCIRVNARPKSQKPRALVGPIHRSKYYGYRQETRRQEGPCEEGPREEGLRQEVLLQEVSLRLSKGSRTRRFPARPFFGIIAPSRRVAARLRNPNFPCHETIRHCP